MKIFFLRLAIVFFSVAASIVIIEFFLRRSPSTFEPITSVYDFSQFNVKYGIEPKPNLRYEKHGAKVRTNSDATFGPEIKKDGTPTIFHLGDSYNAGPGIDYKKNYPYLLEEMLNKSAQKKYQTIILGMGGSSPLQQSLIYKEKLLDIKPSLTVYELYQNDLGDDYIYYYSQYRAKIEYYRKFPEWFVNTRIGEKLYIYFSDKKAKEYEKKYNDTKDVITKNPKYVWDLAMKPGLDDIKATAHIKGSPLVVFYIPSGWDFDNEYDTAKAKPRDKWPSYAEKWAMENNVPFFNLYEDYKKVNTEELNELYLDGDHGYHLTEKGAGIVAEKLFETIQKNKLLQAN